MAINTDNFLLAIVAIAQAATSYMAFRTQRDAAKTREEAVQTRKDTAIVRADSAQTRRDMRTVEEATNSMKDALVLATERGAMAEGLAKGRAEGLAKAKADAANKVDTANEGAMDDDRQARQPEAPA